MGDGLFTPRLRNIDGSRNVFCRKCFRKIGSLSGSDQSFGSAICAICYAGETGEDIAPEIIDALEGNVRLSNGFMAPRSSILPEEKDIPPDPLVGKNRELGLIGYWVRVIKAAVFRTPEEVSKKKKTTSKQVAEEKRRRRVFSIEDLEPKAGNSDIPEINLRSE